LKVLSAVHLLQICSVLGAPPSSDAAASSQDLVRAKTKVPRAEFCGGSFAEMGKVLTKHLRAQVGRVNDCSNFTISELREIQVQLFKVADPRLVSVYVETTDNRRERHASLDDMARYWSSLTAGDVPEVKAMLRDSLCHEVVMRFVHHTTESAKTHLKQDPSFVMPTLPTVKHANDGRIEVQAAHKEYALATGCQVCHSRLVPLPSPEAAQSCKAQIAKQCGKYGQLKGKACADCTSSKDLSACSVQDKTSWCNHADACNGADECPVWPDEFSAPFTLHAGFPKIDGAKSNFYYKYTAEVQLQTVDYYEKCFPFVNARTAFNNLPCKLFFNPKGIYLSQPGRVDCCQFVEGVGAVPPPFLQSYNLSARGVMKPDMYGAQIKTDQWDGPQGFKYWTSAKDDPTYGFGHDIVFQDGPTGVTWRWGKFSVVPQDASLFELPEGKCDEACPKFLSTEELSALHADPQVRHVTSGKANPQAQGVLPTLV